jgi:Tol biopolymer transport system component
LLLASALVCASSPLRAAGRTGAGRIAFEAGGAIYVMDAGGTPTRIVAPKVGVVNMQPALSPDASLVAFSSNVEGKFSIYVVGIDGEGLRRVTDGPGEDSEPAWSPDGSRIAFVRGFDATGSGVFVLTCETAGDILVIDVGDIVSAQSPVEVNLTHGYGGTDPAWSPDGSRIAFASDRAGSYDIYTMASGDGRYVHRLTADASAESDPAWSPDGSWIAYTGKLREALGAPCGNMPIAGSPTCPTTCPATGDDEEEDSLTTTGGPYIYKMAADGSQQKNLTEDGGAAEPVWSPDGSQILFVGGHKPGEAQLFLIASDGTGPWVKLTSDPAQKSSPSWLGALVR